MKHQALVALIAVVVTFVGGAATPAAASTSSLSDLQAQLETLSRTLGTMTTAAAPRGALTQAAAVKPMVPLRPTCRIALDKAVYKAGEKVKVTVSATAATSIAFIDGISAIQGSSVPVPTLGKNGGNVTLVSAKTITDEYGDVTEGRGVVIRVLATSITGHTTECSKGMMIIPADATAKDARLEAISLKVSDVYRALDANHERISALYQQQDRLEQALQVHYKNYLETLRSGLVSVTSYEVALEEQSSTTAEFNIWTTVKNATKKPVGLNENSLNLYVINGGHVKMKYGSIELDNFDIQSVDGSENGETFVLQPGQVAIIDADVTLTLPVGKYGRFSVYSEGVKYFTDPGTNTEEVHADWIGTDTEIDFAPFRKP